MNQFPSSRLSLPLGLFLIFFKKSWRYSQLKVHHRCWWHRWQMEQIFDHKSFSYLVWTPLESRVNLYIHFCLQVHFKVLAAWYCSHYFLPVSLTPVANLPPVSTTLAKLVATFAASVIDTDGKNAAGVVDTAAIWLPVSLIPVGIHRCCWYRWEFTGVVDTSGPPWFASISANFRKNSKQFNGILWGWGETDSWKKPEAKNLLTLYLEMQLCGHWPNLVLISTVGFISFCLRSDIMK